MITGRTCRTHNWKLGMIQVNGAKCSAIWECSRCGRWIINRHHFRKPPKGAKTNA